MAYGREVGDVVRWDDGSNVYFPTVEAKRSHNGSNQILLRWHRGFCSWQSETSTALSVRRDGVSWQTVASLT